MSEERVTNISYLFVQELVSSTPEWMEEANCVNSDLPFISRTPGDTSEQQEVCGGCPVRSECAEYKSNTSIFYGVLGGEQGGSDK